MLGTAVQKFKEKDLLLSDRISNLRNIFAKISNSKDCSKLMHALKRTLTDTYHVVHRDVPVHCSPVYPFGAAMMWGYKEHVNRIGAI